MSNFWGAYQCDGGYAAPRRIATADAVPAIRCLLPTTQSAAAARRCGRFGEPCFCCAKMVRLSTRPKQKQTIKKMELIKTIRTRVGTLRLAELRPLMRFPQFVACSRLHSPQRLRAVAAVSANHVFAAQKWFDYPPVPNKNRPSKRWSVFVWWARVDSDHRS